MEDKMGIQQSPRSPRFQNKSGSPGSHTPGTPKRKAVLCENASRGELDTDFGIGAAPFAPPRRRSSLAFSKIASASNARDSADNHSPSHRQLIMETPHRSESDVGRETAIATPLRRSGPSPGRAAQLQRVFQSANATLHLDMHFAASPAGSIDSRLPSELSPIKSEMQIDTHDLHAAESEAREWRYSTMPSLLAAPNLDVREPLPTVSPTLPEINMSPIDDDDAVPFEPTSSGFASPIDVKEEHVQSNLPLLPSSSPPAASPTTECESVAGLEDPMTKLKVDDSRDSQYSGGSESPTGLLKTGSAGSSKSPIFLSLSAKAAAESAKAKRKLKGSYLKVKNDDETYSVPKQPRHEVDTLNTPYLCPDVAAHRLLWSGICPDPSVHVRPTVQMPASECHLNTRKSSSIPTAHPQAMSTQRISATGSPMPFARPRGSVRKILPEHDPHHSYHYMRNLPGRRIDRPCRRPFPPTTSNNERYQPGWEYALEPSDLPEKPGDDVYSFSTAAAKVTGESSAPDSRIRDSYRTDTLTPLVKPLNRFRRNGIGADVQNRGSRKYYRSPGLSTRPPRAEGSRDEDLMEDVRFRSSPPRPSTRYPVTYEQRKRRRDPRVYTPEFDVVEDDALVNTRPESESEIMTIDEDTRDAVRMSIYGTNTPEPLHGHREGIRELSPNVKTWRKGMHGGPLSRKKRRPSYWDSDLEEVRMSPAGRGGIASSPTMSKRSMTAEFEEVAHESHTVGMPEDDPHVDKSVNGVKAGPLDLATDPTDRGSVEVKMSNANETEIA